MKTTFRYDYDISTKRKNFLTRIEVKTLKKFQSKARKKKLKIQDLIESYMNDFIVNGWLIYEKYTQISLIKYNKEQKKQLKNLIKLVNKLTR